MKPTLNGYSEVTVKETLVGFLAAEPYQDGRVRDLERALHHVGTTSPVWMLMDSNEYWNLRMGLSYGDPYPPLWASKRVS